MSYKEPLYEISDEFLSDFELSIEVINWAFKEEPSVISFNKYKEIYETKIYPYYCLLALKNDWNEAIPIWLTPDFILNKEEITNIREPNCNEILVSLEGLSGMISNVKISFEEVEFVKFDLNKFRSIFPFNNISKMVDCGNAPEEYI